MSEFILPDGIETEQVGISAYIRYIINKYREAVLPESTSDLETLEYIVSKGDF